MSLPANCQLCPRLSAYRTELKNKYPEYHNLPVDGFGNPDAGLLIVGLAPGLHGANASGRPFTGDASGAMLFQTIHRFGFASQASSVSSDDNMRLSNCRITNAVKCLPPQNRPQGDEIKHCNQYLRAELASLPAGSVILALGAIAHRSVLMALDLAQAPKRFRHRAIHLLSGQLRLIDSYHCSRYNINTGRLDQNMFSAVFEDIRGMLA